MAMNQTVTRDSPLNNSKSIAVPLIVYSVTFALVIIAVVAMRFYVRLGVIQKFGNDDIALGLTLVRSPEFGPVGYALTRSPGVNYWECHRNHIWYVLTPCFVDLP